MKNSIFKIILEILLFSVHVFVSAQDLKISSRTEHIQIENDTSFTRNVTVLINGTDEETAFPVFYDSELEVISDINVYKNKGKRFKLMKYPVIHEEELKIGLISSKKVKFILIPPEMNVKISYKVSCNELRYLSDLPLFTYFDVDTLNYHLKIPENYQLYYDVIYKDSIEFMNIDSSKFEAHTLWDIEIIPIKVEPDPLMYFGIYKNIKVPLMRIALIPEKFRDNKKEHLNNWFLHELKATRGLDSSAINKIDEITNGITDPVQIVNTLYNYVRTNFKYVAIEIGMGAFIPSHVNEVFMNKQGDCKDLSNFLSEALNYKGIKSYIALAATFDHISDCDFPSLCSANHVICVAYPNDKTIILDPTDPIHLPETTVQSIQDKTIFIINPDGGAYYKINRYTPQDNLINYEINLTADSDEKIMQGEFKVNYTGISGNYVRAMFFYSNEVEKEEKGKEHYKSIFNSKSIAAFKCNYYSDTVVVKGKLDFDMKVFDDNTMRYLFLDFLPRLIETETRGTMLDGTYLGNTMDKKVKVSIKMDDPFEAFDLIEHSFSEDGVSLKLQISNPAESILECNYEFILDYFFIDSVNLKKINDILKSYNKITNEPIILKNKR